jgi:alpha-mannosidase
MPAIKKIFAIPHFHFDVEWWKNYEGYSQDALNAMNGALELLDKYDNFRFVIDQYLTFEPILKTKNREKILQYIKSGKIELVGCTLAAPDENIPTGESLVRQFVYGRKALQALGIPCVTGWMIDEFGHTIQLPQILSKCGLKYLAFSRGIKWYRRHPTDFFWMSPDGSAVLTHWLCNRYGGMVMSLDYEREMDFNLTTKAPRCPTENMLVPFGDDFSVPNEKWLGFVEDWNSSHDVKVEFATPREYFEEVSKAKALETKTGEFNPIFTGCYESREKIKKEARRTQNRILEAEKLCSIAHLLGDDYPDFSEAWRLILTNDFHDIICGTGTDEVYRLTLQRYEHASSIIEKNIESALKFISDRINTSGTGQPIVVFNTLSWERNGLVRLPNSTGKPTKVTDEKGTEIPSQKVGSEIIFVAKIPPLGYRVFFITEGAPDDRTGLVCGENFLENEFYRVEVNADGNVGRVYDKEANREAVEVANRIIMEEDVGNLWTVQRLGSTPTALKSGPAEVKLVERGPIRATIEVARKIEKTKIVQRIHLHSGLRGIFFETRADFRGKDRRVRVLFAPKNRGIATFEVPYAVVERSSGHWAAQNWVDVGDGKYGVALINEGNPSHEVMDGGALSMTLFRSVSISSPALYRFIFGNLKSIIRNIVFLIKMFLSGFQFIEDAMEYHSLILREYSTSGGKGLKGGINVPDHLWRYFVWWRRSDAWEWGTHKFSYMLLPHSSDWHALPRAGYEFNNPLICVPVEKHEGKLPKEFSFASVEPDNVVMTVLKRAENATGLAARLYESQGKNTEFTLRFFKPIKNAQKVSMTEDEVYEEVRSDGSLDGKLRNWEICTIKLEAER